MQSGVSGKPFIHNVSCLVSNMGILRIDNWSEVWWNLQPGNIGRAAFVREQNLPEFDRMVCC